MVTNIKLQPIDEQGVKDIKDKAQEVLSSVEGLGEVFIRTTGDAPSIGMNWVYPLEDK